jgi:hypothetical protein
LKETYVLPLELIQEKNQKDADALRNKKMTYLSEPEKAGILFCIYLKICNQ